MLYVYRSSIQETTMIKGTRSGGALEQPQSSYSLKSPSVSFGHRVSPALRRMEDARDAVSPEEYSEMLARAKQA